MKTKSNKSPFLRTLIPFIHIVIDQKYCRRNYVLKNHGFLRVGQNQNYQQLIIVLNDSISVTELEFYSKTKFSVLVRTPSVLMFTSQVQQIEINEYMLAQAFFYWWFKRELLRLAFFSSFHFDVTNLNSRQRRMNERFKF